MAGAQAGRQLDLEVAERWRLGGGEGAGCARRRARGRWRSAGSSWSPLRAMSAAVELELVAVEVVELLGVAQDGVEALALDGGEHLGDRGDDRGSCWAGGTWRPGAFSVR